MCAEANVRRRSDLSTAMTRVSAGILPSVLCNSIPAAPSTMEDCKLVQLVLFMVPRSAPRAALL